MLLKKLIARLRRQPEEKKAIQALPVRVYQPSLPLEWKIRYVALEYHHTFGAGIFVDHPEGDNEDRNEQFWPDNMETH